MMKVANAPCSWGVIENTAGERVGYQQVLDEMRKTGYLGTELGDWGFMPTEPKQLRAELAARQLQLLGSWVTVRLYDAAYHKVGVETAVRTARLLAEVGGPDAIVIIGDDHSTVPYRHDHAGRIRPEDGLDKDGWKIYTTGAMRVAEAVKRETGLRSAFHHHASTFVETPEEIKTFLSMTDPTLLGLCFDTGHYALGGGDPVQGVYQYADRIWHVHFKDFNPQVVAQADQMGWGYQQMVGQGVFSELGQGVVDFSAVITALREIGYQGWIVVEQDVLPGMGSPKESAARNRAYLHQLGL
ncbi:MAG: xylose isomerase [Chloroflexi bacterium]|nr:MAG: xylose isomerase [Chloroflexota bacterium]